MKNYMNVTGKNISDNNRELIIENCRIEDVTNYKYLETMINNINERIDTISQRIQAGHRVYHKYNLDM